MLGFQQTRVAVWGLLFGFLTMVAAITAAVYAGMAAYAAREAVAAAQNANESAIAATDAAEMANKIAIESRLDQDRPYALIEVMKNNVGDWYCAEDVPFNWPFQVKNFGIGPAILKSIQSECFIGENIPSVAHWTSHRLTGGAPLGDAEIKILGSNDSSAVFSDITSRSELCSGFQGDNNFVWLRIRATYSDYRGREFVTEACYRQQHSFFRADEYGGQKYNYRT